MHCWIEHIRYEIQIIAISIDEQDCIPLKLTSSNYAYITTNHSGYFIFLDAFGTGNVSTLGKLCTSKISAKCYVT